MSPSAVPALSRAMAIVDLLAESGQAGVSVAEISQRTGIAKSTTALLCGVLEEEGMARRHDGRYRLGRRFLLLAGDYLSSVDHMGEFYDEVRRQPTMSRAAARLALLDGTDVIYLARYQASAVRHGTAGVGDRFPATTTATGKAMLATLPDSAVADRFRGFTFPRYTEHSILSLPELLRDLEQVRERGYATDDEESTLGVVCFAIPVVEPGEIAKLSVSCTMSSEIAAQTTAEVVVAELHKVAEVFRNPLAGKTF